MNECVEHSRCVAMIEKLTYEGGAGPGNMGDNDRIS